MIAPVVPEDVLDAVVAHARSTRRPERESAGMVVVRLEDWVATRYVPLRNWARGDHRFKTHGSMIRERVLSQLGGGEDAYLVHSHPSGFPWPSTGDLSGASRLWLDRPYGILAMLPTSRLRWFVIRQGRPGKGNRYWESLDL